MTDLRYSESVVVARSPEDLYDMVSDVTRMGEWSPVRSRQIIGRGCHIHAVPAA